jgi:2-hydroxychromene-2-carboxylate isomerase
MSDPGATVAFVFAAPLTVCVDVRHPQALLALAPVRALAAELRLHVDWLPFASPPPKALFGGGAGDDRGSRHRRLRARYLEADLARYADAQGLAIHPPYRAPDPAPAHLGLLWTRETLPERTADYLEEVVSGHWAETLAVDDLSRIRRLIETIGGDGGGFDAFAAGRGPSDLDLLRERLVAAGVFAVPSLVAGSQVFLGRAHIPMIRKLLSGSAI